MATKTKQWQQTYKANPFLWENSNVAEAQKIAAVRNRDKARQASQRAATETTLLDIKNGKPVAITEMGENHFVNTRTKAARAQARTTVKQLARDPNNTQFAKPNIFQRIGSTTGLKTANVRLWASVENAATADRAKRLLGYGAPERSKSGRYNKTVRARGDREAWGEVRAHDKAKRKEFNAKHAGQPWRARRAEAKKLGRIERPLGVLGRANAAVSHGIATARNGVWRSLEAVWRAPKTAVVKSAALIAGGILKAPAAIRKLALMTTAKGRETLRNEKAERALTRVSDRVQMREDRANPERANAREMGQSMAPILQEFGRQGPTRDTGGRDTGSRGADGRGADGRGTGQRPAGRPADAQRAAPQTWPDRAADGRGSATPAQPRRSAAQPQARRATTGPDVTQPLPAQPATAGPRRSADGPQRAAAGPQQEDSGSMPRRAQGRHDPWKVDRKDNTRTQTMRSVFNSPNTVEISAKLPPDQREAFNKGVAAMGKAHHAGKFENTGQILDVLAAQKIMKAKGMDVKIGQGLESNTKGLGPNQLGKVGITREGKTDTFKAVSPAKTAALDTAKVAKTTPAMGR